MSSPISTGKEDIPLKQRAISGLLWGGLSNFFQQILALAFGILLARLLSPADYGIVGLLTIFSLMASSLQESGFTVALANKKEVSEKDYNAVFWASLFISLSIYLILFFSAPYIALFYKTPELTPLARYLFLGFLIGSTGIAHNAYLFRNLKVKEKAISTTVGVAVSGIVGVTLAYMGYSYWGLATQTLTYSATISAMMWRYSKFRPSFDFNLKPIKELLGFSSKILLSNILNHINNNIFSVFLGRFYGKPEVGFFTQAYKWANMGQSVIANMSHGFAQPMLYTLANDQERQTRVFRKLLNFIAFVSFPALFCLGISAKEFIIITITKKWLQSVILLQILCFGAAFLPIINLYGNFILSKGKSNIYMLNIVSLGLTQLLLVYLVYPYGIESIAITITVINIIWVFIWQYHVTALLKVSYITLVADLAKYLVFALIAAGFATYIGGFFGSVYVSIIIKSIVLVGMYIGLLYLIKSEILAEAFIYLENRFVRKKT